MSDVTCKNHPSVEFEDRCSECMEPICSGCLVQFKMQPLCPSCAKTKRRNQKIVRAVGILVALSVVGGLGYLAVDSYLDYLEKEAQAPSFDYGRFSDEIETLQSQLEQESCDRSKIVNLVKAYYKAGDYRSAIDRSNAFIDECGKHSRLLWTVYESHKKLSEWEQAADVATRLIEEDRYDKDFWWWRGYVYEQMEQWQKAAHDYRQSLSLVPRLRSIPFNLADVYEKMEEPCRAILPLERFLHYHPEVENRRQVRTRIDKLYEKCGDYGSDGSGTVDLTEAHGTLRTLASVEGSDPGQFVVDTGATYVAVSPEFAQKVGLDTANAASIMLATANGVKDGKLVTVDSVSVRGVEAQRVEVVVVDDLPPNVDGLLGMSFLSRFKVDIDHRDGQMTLEPRTEGQR